MYARIHASACIRHQDHSQMSGVLRKQPTHVWRVTMTTTNSCMACYYDNNQLVSDVLPWQQPTHVWRVTTTTTNSCLACYYDSNRLMSRVTITTDSVLGCYHDNNQLMYGVLSRQQPTWVCRVTMTTTNSCLACYPCNIRQLSCYIARPHKNHIGLRGNTWRHLLVTAYMSVHGVWNIGGKTGAFGMCTRGVVTLHKTQDTGHDTTRHRTHVVTRWLSASGHQWRRVVCRCSERHKDTHMARASKHVYVSSPHAQHWTTTMCLALFDAINVPTSSIVTHHIVTLSQSRPECHMMLASTRERHCCVFHPNCGDFPCQSAMCQFNWPLRMSKVCPVHV